MIPPLGIRTNGSQGIIWVQAQIHLTVGSVGTQATLWSYCPVPECTVGTDILSNCQNPLSCSFTHNGYYGVCKSQWKTLRTAFNYLNRNQNQYCISGGLNSTTNDLRHKGGDSSHILLI